MPDVQSPRDGARTLSVEPTSQSPSSSPQKRMRSPDSTKAGSSKKHRSSQACYACRMRKVRCDVLLTGDRCTNCRLDKSECTVLASRRGKNNARRATRKPALDKDRNGPSGSIPSRNSMTDSSETLRGRYTQPVLLPRPIPTPSSSAGDVPVCVTFDEETQDEEDDHQPRDMPTPDPGLYALVSPHDQSSASNHAPPPSIFNGLPGFIAPLPSHLLGEDIDFLSRKGAFIIPEPRLRDEILRNYIFSIHPIMPILDVNTFVEAFSGEHKNNRISLLLFQAVMFTGLASVDLQVIHDLGFESTKKAREVFFTRTRLLYDLDVESDEVSVLQSLLLMSWWYGSPKQRRHTWHWTGLALSGALNLGLHREPTTQCGSDNSRRLRRRLWWSLYIRDRLLALGTRRPMRIRDDSFDLAMLTLDDFDLDIPRDFDRRRRQTSDVEDTMQTALMCIELAKLCTIIGHVLSSQYTTLHTRPEVPYTMMVVPKRHDFSVHDLDECDREINEWFQSLGANTARQSPPEGDQNGRESCAEVHWSLLNMMHLTLVNVLHRTQALQSSPDTAEGFAVQKTSRSKVKNAARSVTRLAQTMLRRDQVRYMGVPGVTALIAASLSHMLDIRSDDEDVRDASVFRFYQSMQILQSLRGIYASADSAVSFLVSAIRKAGIPVPSQVSTPTNFMSTSPGAFVSPAKTALERPSVVKDTTANRSRRWTIAQSQPSASDWLLSSIHTLQPSMSGSSQDTTLIDIDQEVPSVTATILPASTEFLSPHNIPFGTNHTGAFNMSDTNVASVRDLGNIGADASLFEWNNAFDYGIDTSMDISFDTDFYFDSLGLLDG